MAYETTMTHSSFGLEEAISICTFLCVEQPRRLCSERCLKRVIWVRVRHCFSRDRERPSPTLITAGDTTSVLDRRNGERPKRTWQRKENGENDPKPMAGHAMAGRSYQIRKSSPARHPNMGSRGKGDSFRTGHSTDAKIHSTRGSDR